MSGSSDILGTYSTLVTPLLADALGVVLGQSSARALLIGPGSERFRTQFLARWPELTDRVTATGMVPPDRLSSYLQACDVMVQPYPDGISTRRTSSLALLATSVPVVSNEGRLSESFWRETGAVALAAEPDGRRIGETVLGLLDDAGVRGSFASRGHALYEQRFDVRHAVEPLLATV